ncbi:hypothetical protein ACGFNU_42245 [Spirillospora sp. NPDC048911]|uniref:hypothetical protein n=1 Tax=Spirillospora sp. NPDC048911 TaxID=3364527 RepID=UPI0037109B6F
MAMDEMSFPPPVVHTSPEGKTYVGVRTGLWITSREPGQGVFADRRVQAEAGGQVVTAVAIAQGVTWNTGEGSVLCKDPGSAASTTCGHTYKRSSHGQPNGKYQISATINWLVTWRCEGPCEPRTGTLTPEIPAGTEELTVGEIQTGSRP